jgi:hypothetical protein
MPNLTMGPNISDGAGRLIESIDKLAGPFDEQDVLTAAMNWMACVLSRIACANDLSPNETMNFTVDNLNLIIVSVQNNMDRQPQPTDISISSN